MPPTGGGIDLTLPQEDWEEFFFYHVCLHGILSLAWLMRSRGVSRGWRERIQKSLPLLRGVSFHVGVKGEDVLRALGLVAGGSLQLVGMALCRELSACDIEEILKLLHATCPGREVDITGCSAQVILRALSIRALSTLGASPLHVHKRLMALAGGSAGALSLPSSTPSRSECDCFSTQRLPLPRRRFSRWLQRPAMPATK